MMEKIKLIWSKIKTWFIKIWNKIVGWFKKQEEIKPEETVVTKPSE